VEGAYEQLPTSELSAFIDRDAPTISEETDILTIAQTFLNTGTRRLPVLRDGKLIGQISRRDVLQAAMNLMHVAPDREKALLYLSSLIERDDAPIG
jgi:predicted transcriptional regulator